MSRTRDRRIGHPAMSKSLLQQPHGLGAPAPAASSSNPLDAVGAAFQQAVGSILAPGEVLIGVALIVVGLLLATGQMGRVARGAGRAGLFAASRGTIR